MNDLERHNRRHEDRLVREWRRWMVRALYAFGLLLAVSVWGFVRVQEEAAQNERQATTLATFAADLRDASVQACERQNDVREDLRHDREVLLTLVSSVLDAGGPEDPAVRREFVKGRRELREPVAFVACRRKYPTPNGWMP